MYEGDAPYMQKFISEYLDEQFGNNNGSCCGGKILNETICGKLKLLG